VLSFELIVNPVNREWEKGSWYLVAGKKGRGKRSRKERPFVIPHR
jgi:energy-coupling factor transporter ATP-binding protein EcfA2